MTLPTTVCQAENGSGGTAASSNDTFLLHKACGHHDGSKKSFELIQFFAQKFPTAVSTPDDSGKLPLHHLFLSGLYRSSLAAKDCATFATIRYIVDLFPSGICYNDYTGTTPLITAISQAYSPQVIDYLASRMSAGQTTVLEMSGITLNLPRCQSLVRVLHKIKTLICRPSQWTWDGLICLLDHLLLPKSNSSVQKVVLDWIPRTFFMANQRIVNMMKNFVISSSRSLKEIHLQIKNSWYDKNRQADKFCLQNLQDIFHHHQHMMHTSTNNPGVQFYISLHAFQLYRTTLEDFVLRSNSIMKSLSLNCCTIFDDNNNTATTPATPTATPPVAAAATNDEDGDDDDDIIDKEIIAWKDCPMERIELVHTRMTGTTFEGLLRRVSVLPQIRHLKIVFKEADNFGQDLDLTSFVAHMLGQAPPQQLETNAEDNTNLNTTTSSNKRRRIMTPSRIPLQTLTIEGLYVDATLLAEYANACSCFVQYIRYGSPLEDLQYRTALNYFGRRECHDVVKASKVSLVEKSLQALHRFEEVDWIFKTGVAFGLLQGCPSVWALDT